ncbi:hypothetical protein BKA70DRAFT_1226243 [Coprinopsis sp. MPI-PUGE-AT-0042]|nr:hypothetical protein BKA70DRAFT_1226243 [Coprinopsis sp. MPI-PUGE-AT-0042]
MSIQSNSNLANRNLRERSLIIWDSLTVSREGGLDVLQLADAKSQAAFDNIDHTFKHDGLNRASDSVMANETYGGMPASQSLNPAHIIPPTASSEYSATSRSVTIINRRHKEMTKEEIIRAKDAVILAQRRMIELLRRRVRELKKELYIADRVQALTREILDLSLEPVMELVL